jgi:insertion element IS1 protein InsB
VGRLEATVASVSLIVGLSLTFCLTRMLWVVDFKVGSRTKANLQVIADKAPLASPKKVCTDGLVIYKNLIPERLHHCKSMGTRHIERFNLNLRTHLKRLGRKTICFSRSKEMLEACLRIYFWADRLRPQVA